MLGSSESDARSLAFSVTAVVALMLRAPLYSSCKHLAFRVVLPAPLSQTLNLTSLSLLPCLPPSSPPLSPSLSAALHPSLSPVLHSPVDDPGPLLPLLPSL